ncbi:DUF423 domain-containing protein [Ferruginibacter yonginensis]|uniref:DUF423 domain-containing protein n=1 Tax=Ferruginibacter yonginensis TaxID=1310416 RepID=A0ABV8QRA2_9BACT
MHKGFLSAGIVSAGLSVILGAFAAHGIKSKVTADVLAIFETGVRYQMYHAFALLFTAIMFQYFDSKQVLWAGYLFIIGIVLFSGSLYLLTYFKGVGNNAFNWLGAITPFGGTAFIAGWVLLLVAVITKK